MKYYLISFLLLMACFSLNAQSKDTASVAVERARGESLIKPIKPVVKRNFAYWGRQQLNPSFEKPAEFLDNLDISGYYRFIANYRQMQTVYSHLESNKNNLFVGDDSQIPQLMLNLKGYAGSNTFFGTDF